MINFGEASTAAHTPERQMLLQKTSNRHFKQELIEISQGYKLRGPVPDQSICA
jgi:hypothetical protein